MKITALLDTLDVPYNYDHFPGVDLQSETGQTIIPDLPYIIYQDSTVSTFMADGVVYKVLKTYTIYVYTKVRDLDLEGRVEVLLHDVSWTKNTEYYASEGFYETAFTFSVWEEPTNGSE